MAVCDVVVVGSYPPAPGPATSATLTAVRRSWDAGLTVRVVSYRPGAADQVVPVAGPLAGWRLEQVRRHYQGPTRLVLVAQDGVPFSDRSPAGQFATAVGLVMALRRYGETELMVGEDPRVIPAAMRAIVKAVDRVSVTSQELAGQLCSRYKLAPGRVAVEPPDAYPMVGEAIDPSSLGLFQPGAGRSLTVVAMPTTSPAERVKARVLSSRVLVVRRLRGR